MKPEGTVFVVDDDPKVRESLKKLMESAGFPFQVFSTAEAFLEAYDPATPGCLILDVHMPGMGGMELQEQLAAKGVPIPMIVITGHGTVPMAVEALQRGAVDFLEKPVDSHRLLRRIRQGLALDAERRRAQAERDAVAARFALLVPREREVVNLIAKGMTNKQIAAQLGVRVQAVGASRARAMDKLQVDSLPELIRLVLEARVG